MHLSTSKIFSLMNPPNFSPASTGEHRNNFTNGKTTKVKSPSTSLRVTWN